MIVRFANEEERDEMYQLEALREMMHIKSEKEDDPDADFDWDEDNDLDDDERDEDEDEWDEDEWDEDEWGEDESDYPLEGAESVALQMIRFRPQITFEIQGSVSYLNGDALMDYVINYDGAVCTSRNTGWYTYIGLENYTSVEECEQNVIHEYRAFPSEAVKTHCRESLRNAYSEVKKHHGYGMYYTEKDYTYHEHTPMGKPQIMMWNTPEDESVCSFCHSAIPDGEGVYKRLRAQSAPTCRICRACNEKYDLSGWEEIKE